MWSKSRFKCAQHVCRSLAPLATPLWNSTGRRQDAQLCLMAVALLTTSIHALLLCVLLVLTLQMSTSKTAVPECGALKMVENAEVIPFSEKNLQYIRYRCLDGYKRKAGTSNLAICEFNSTTKKAHWKYGHISCIRDPSLPMTTHSTLTSPTTSDQQHYTAFPTTGESTIYIMDTTSSTTSGSQSTTILPTTVGKATVGTTTQQPRSSEHATTSRETAQSVPESTYISTDETPKLSTISYTMTGHDSSIPGSQSTTILPTTVGKATVGTTTQQPRSSEHAATSRETAQSVPESTYISTDETPKLSTISYYTTTGHDSSIPGSQSTTILPTTVGKATVGTTTQQPRSSEHAATSRETAQSVPESTYISTDETPKLSTISYYTTTGHDSSIPDPSLWQQEKTIGSIAGVLLFLTLLVICIVIWIKRRNQHSPVPQEELQEEHDYSADQGEIMEESRNL
ncbi:interleukin-15 receptor subunit alpha isoform X2 [Lithobates pipiens]